MAILWRDDDISVDTDLEKLREIQSVFENHNLKELYSVVPFGKSIYANYDHSMPLAELEKRLGDEPITENIELVSFLKDSVKKGHLIGIHGWQHTRVTDYHNAKERIKDAKDYLEKLLDTEVKYFIPPFNHYNYDIINICNELNLTLLRDGGQLEKMIENNDFSIHYMYWFHYWRLNTKDLNEWLTHFQKTNL